VLGLGLLSLGYGGRNASREGGSRASGGGVLMDRQDICLPIHGTVNHKYIPCIDTTSNSNTIARRFHPPQRPLRASPPISPIPQTSHYTNAKTPLLTTVNPTTAQPVRITLRFANSRPLSHTKCLTPFQQ